MRILWFFLLMTVLIPMDNALAKSMHSRPQSGPAPPSISWSQEGRASMYHRKYIGLKTTSGAIYDPDLLTAAHRDLPLGTLVRVTSLSSGKSVVVRINDRLGRRAPRKTIIDLSFAAARAIGLTKKQGVVRVRVEFVSADKPK